MARCEVEFDRADALDWTLSRPITESHIRCWTGVWVRGDEEMTGIEHMSVNTAVHNDFGAGTRGRAVIEVTGNDG